MHGENEIPQEQIVEKGSEPKGDVSQMFGFGFIKGVGRIIEQREGIGFVATRALWRAQGYGATEKEDQQPGHDSEGFLGQSEEPSGPAQAESGPGFQQGRVEGAKHGLIRTRSDGHMVCAQQVFDEPSRPHSVAAAMVKLKPHLGSGFPGSHPDSQAGLQSQVDPLGSRKPQGRRFVGEVEVWKRIPRWHPI
jgi:hypothetical protein